MLNFMLGAAFNWGDPMFWILIALLVVLVVMMVFRFKQQKKAQADQVSLLDRLKVGDRVTTHIGIYGRIVKITETNMGKVFTIETGDKNKSELELDYRYIAGLDEKQIVTYDANGNVIDPSAPKVEEKPVDVKDEPKVDEVATNEASEEKPKKSKKKTAKKDDELN